MKDHWDPISEDESLLRRIPNKPDFVDWDAPQPIDDGAFRPGNDEPDGISVYRPACGVTPLQVAQSGRNRAGYVVARLQARDLFRLNFTLEPSNGDPPLVDGHATIVELNTKSRTERKAWCREMQSTLARIASADIVYVPTKPN